MIIDRVCFERVVPGADRYESLRIRLEASISPDENSGDAVRALDRQISDLLTGADIKPAEDPSAKTVSACR